MNVFKIVNKINSILKRKEKEIKQLDTILLINYDNSIYEKIEKLSIECIQLQEKKFNYELRYSLY